MIRMASRGDTPHGGSYVCVCQQDDALARPRRSRATRTEDRRALAREGRRDDRPRRSRAAPAEQRRRRLRAVKLHPVSYAKRRDPRTGKHCSWSTAVRRRLDGRRLNADCHRSCMVARDQRAPLAYNPCRVTPTVHLPWQRDGKGVDPPFRPPTGELSALLCWKRSFIARYF